MFKSLLFLHLKDLNNQGWDVRMLGTDFSTIVVSVLQYQISFWLLLSVSWLCINGRSIIGYRHSSLIKGPRN